MFSLADTDSPHTTYQKLNIKDNKKPIGETLHGEDITAAKSGSFDYICENTEATFPYVALECCNLRPTQEDRIDFRTIHKFGELSAEEQNSALNTTFEELQTLCDKYETVGACVMANIITSKGIVTANLGDSESFIVGFNGKCPGVFKRLNSSLDHPNDSKERQRLKEFHKTKEDEKQWKKFVTRDGKRLRTPIKDASEQIISYANDGLAVSGALGDTLYKKVGLRQTPNINRSEMHDKEIYLVAGCDGLTEGNEDTRWIGSSITRAKNFETPLIQMPMALLKAAKTNRSTDNISIIIVKINPLENNLSPADGECFLVIDGHGGKEVADIIHQNFMTILQANVDKQWKLRHGLTEEQANPMGYEKEMQTELQKTYPSEEQSLASIYASNNPHTQWTPAKVLGKQTNILHDCPELSDDTQENKNSVGI